MKYLSDLLSHYYSTYPTVTVFVIMAIVLLLVYMALWFTYIDFRLLMTRFWMHFPFIGTISMASRKTYHNQKWFSGEEDVCRKFMPYYGHYDKDILLYSKSKNYLAKIDELDRTPIPIKYLFALILLVIVEAYTFSYLLAGYIVIDASEFIQSITGFGIAFVLSIILLGLTHAMGTELYKNSIKKRIKEYGVGHNGVLKPDYSVTLENTYKDKNEPIYMQMLNRFKSNSSLRGNYILSFITILIMLIVAFGAITIRLETYNKYVLEESAIMQTNVFNDLPNEAQNNQKKIDDKITKDIQQSSKIAGWTSFIVLAFLFIGIQIWGIMLGYSYGFVGKESYRAFKYSHRFATEYFFKKHFDDKKSHIKQIAQKNLHTLQNKIAKKFAKGKIIDSSNLSEKLVNTAHDRTYAAYVKKENDEMEKMNKERFKIQEDENV